MAPASAMSPAISMAAAMADAVGVMVGMSASSRLHELIDEQEEFLHPTAQKVFADDALQLWWSTLGADKVAQEIVFAVSEVEPQ